MLFNFKVSLKIEHIESNPPLIEFISEGIKNKIIFLDFLDFLKKRNRKKNESIFIFLRLILFIKYMFFLQI
jgi:hypothetical protein